MQSLADWRRSHGHWSTRRADQARHWFEAEVRHGLLSALAREPAKGIMARLGDQVAEGRATPEAAAAEMLGLLGRGGDPLPPLPFLPRSKHASHLAGGHHANGLDVLLLTTADAHRTPTATVSVPRPC